MDTNAIKLFVNAAQLLNITLAGKKMGLAPAVASAKLAKLEKHLGVELLHRTTRKVSLSAEGLEFLPYAQEILAQEMTAKAVLGLENPLISGTLRFTAPATFAQMHIAQHIPEYLDRHPDIKIEMRLTDTILDLVDGGYDLALRNAQLIDSTLKARKLADDRRILCAAPDYLSKYEIPQTPDDVHKHKLLCLIGQTSRDIQDNNGNIVGRFDPIQNGARLTLDNGSSIKQVTVSGAGISMNSLWSVYQEIKSGALVHVLPEYELMDHTNLWLVYPKSYVLTAKVRSFMDYLIEKVGKSPCWFMV